MTPTRPPSPREAQIEAVFRKLVRAQLGGMAFKMAPTHVGLPDRLVVLPVNRFYLVELKTDVGRLSEAQKHLHSTLRDRVGVPVVTLYGIAQVREWCRKVAAEYDKPDTGGHADTARRGDCPDCGRECALVKSGRLPRHSLSPGSLCPGSGALPASPVNS